MNWEKLNGCYVCKTMIGTYGISESKDNYSIWLRECNIDDNVKSLDEAKRLCLKDYAERLWTEYNRILIEFRKWEQ